jgi:hypothetical protein
MSSQLEASEGRARELYDCNQRLEAHVHDLESRKRAPLYQKKQEEELRAATEKATEADLRATEAELRTKEAKVCGLVLGLSFYRPPALWGPPMTSCIEAVTAMCLQQMSCQPVHAVG